MKVLFISWDSDQTNYLENLFFPIFDVLQKRLDCQFFVLQFSWAATAEVSRINTIAKSLEITYQQQQVRRKPHPIVGTLLTTMIGKNTVKSMIRKHGITHLMPRSTMPAIMVNSISRWLKSRNLKLIFDADGLPLQERVDYAGLKVSSLHYKWLKKAETKMLKLADIVLVRSNLSKDIHLQNIGQQYHRKFFKVSNGRDKNLFKPDRISREKIRKDLALLPSTQLWLYSGSLGPQYLLNKMLQIFETYHIKNPDSKFLFLVRNPSFLVSVIPSRLHNAIIIKSIAYNLLPDYYAAADLGISLRKSAPSLAGIAPIKVSEYLLAGLPILCSRGIGDLDKMIGDESFCFMYPETEWQNFEDWLNKIKADSRDSIRSKAIPLFALENSAMEYEQALKASNA